MTDELSDQSPGPTEVKEAAARVLGAVDLPVVLDGEMLDRLLAVLGEHLLLLGNGKKRANQVTQREAEAIEKALTRLCQLIENLQDRSNPPTRLTPDPRDRRGSSTPLDYWLTPYRFPSQSGAPSAHDWPRIARLLAIYEIAFDRHAKASPKDATQTKPHPTLRFLDAALQEASTASGAPPPDPFSPDTLRAYLNREGRSKIASWRQELEQILGISEG